MMAMKLGGCSLQVLSLSLAAQISTMLPVFLMGSLFPLMRQDLDLNASVLGTVVACFFGFSALGSAGLAGSSDLYGPWIVARVALGVTACLCAILPFIVGVWSLAAVMALAGLANGTVQPATNVAVSTAVSPERQGFAFGLKQASIPFAAFFAGLAVPIIALPAGWHVAFWIAALLPFSLIFLVPSRTLIPSVGILDQREVRGWSKTTLIQVGIISGLGAGSANAMVAFFVTSVSAQGISVAAAGVLMAVGGISSIIIRIALGAVADRISLPLFTITASLLGCGAGAYALFAIGGGPATVVVATFLAFGLGWGWAGLLLLAIVRGNRATPGRATGTIQSGLFLGAVIGPLSFGWIVAHIGIAPAWWTLAIAATLAAILALRVASKVQTTLIINTTPSPSSDQQESING
jgi:MFS family permease